MSAEGAEENIGIASNLMSTNNRMTAALSALPNFIEFHVHALTGVAINCRPFGPQGHA